MVAVVGGGPLFTSAADHLDAPSAKADHRIDITDIYIFRAGSGNTRLIVNVDGLITPGAASRMAVFRPNALYEFKIDTTGDGAADLAYRVKFTNPSTLAGGAKVQGFVVKRALGADARGNSWTGRTVAIGRTTPAYRSVRTFPLIGGGRVFAGIRDDPFFFDLDAFKMFKTKLLAGTIDTSDFCSPGTDFFAGTNVLSIVIDLPNARLGGNGRLVGFFATTAVSRSFGFEQRDRMGRPAINTVFNHTDATKEANNRTRPTDDPALLRENVIGVLDALTPVSGYTAGQKAAIANVLLPDTLTYTTNNGSGFLNGRRAANDVIDAEFALLTNTPLGTVKDCVNGNDKAFLSSFPTLAGPH